METDKTLSRPTRGSGEPGVFLICKLGMVTSVYQGSRIKRDDKIWKYEHHMVSNSEQEREMLLASPLKFHLEMVTVILEGGEVKMPP